MFRKYTRRDRPAVERCTKDPVGGLCTALRGTAAPVDVRPIRVLGAFMTGAVVAFVALAGCAAVVAAAPASRHPDRVGVDPAVSLTLDKHVLQRSGERVVVSWAGVRSPSNADR